MGNFIIPDGPMPQPVPPPPPLDPRVAWEEKTASDTRVESELNRFIAFKQDAMFNNPDAFYRTEGENAIHAAPVARKNLEQLRSDLLDGLANDYQRKRLGAALDAQMTVARDGITRHVAEQSLVWQRQTALDRIDLLVKEATLHHSDDDLIGMLGAAAANAARAHARVGDASPVAEIEDQAAAQPEPSSLQAGMSFLTKWRMFRLSLLAMVKSRRVQRALTQNASQNALRNTQVKRCAQNGFPDPTDPV